MDHNPIGRFSSRVADYVRFRPAYPPEIVKWLAQDCGLTENSVVADIGSGTGLFAKLLLDTGCEVFGVEPNEEMRSAGEEYLRGYARFHSVAGRAEETTLEAASVDVVTAGQAFHWFDPERTRHEFIRILRSPGWVVLVWNQRLTTGDAFLEGYEALLKRYAPEYEKVDHRRIDSDAITGFFGHSHWRKIDFDNRQEFDLEGVQGRSRSASYTPPAGDPAHQEMMADLERLFAATAHGGLVTFAYETNVYYGTLLPA